jgi:hypothetical protein
MNHQTEDAKKDFARESIHRVIDEIERLNPIECGAHDLDVDELRDGLQPLISAPEITTHDLMVVRDSLVSMRDRIEDWRSYRESITDEVLDIIQAAAPELEEEAAPIDAPHRSPAELQRPGLGHAISHDAPGEGGYWQPGGTVRNRAVDGAGRGRGQSSLHRPDAPPHDSRVGQNRARLVHAPAPGASHPSEPSSSQPVWSWRLLCSVW